MQYIIVYIDEDGDKIAYDTVYTNSQMNLQKARCTERYGNATVVDANGRPPSRRRHW